MTIKEIIQQGKLITSCETPLKKYVVVNVGYKTFDGEDDETQLDLENCPVTKAGIEELSKLFASLTKELKTTVNRVTYVDIVASALSKNELEDMGY